MNCWLLNVIRCMRTTLWQLTFLWQSDFICRISIQLNLQNSFALETRIRTFLDRRIRWAPQQMFECTSLDACAKCIGSVKFYFTRCFSLKWIWLFFLSFLFAFKLKVAIHFRWIGFYMRISMNSKFKSISTSRESRERETRIQMTVFTVSSSVTRSNSCMKLMSNLHGWQYLHEHTHTHTHSL